MARNKPIDKFDPLMDYNFEPIDNIPVVEEKVEVKKPVMPEPETVKVAPVAPKSSKEKRSTKEKAAAEEKKALCLRLPKNLHTYLSHKSKMEEKPVVKIIVELIEEYADKDPKYNEILSLHNK